MRRMISWALISFWTFSSVFLHGCAATTPFTQKDMSAISPLKVARYETPQINEMTFGRMLLGATVGAVLFAGVGAGLGYGLAMGSVDKQAPIPDLGKLVMDKFVERASKEIPNWPTTTFEEQPIGEDYSYKSGTLLTFRASGLLDFGAGLLTQVYATMTDSKGNVLWKKAFLYKSSDFDRKKSIDEYEADNFKLLKEELEFAADKTVSDFIEHFKNGS